MVDFHHIHGEAVERLWELAERARATLLAAGIPVSDNESTSLTGGALIEVDTGDDAAGGVYISWDLSPELNDEVNNYLLSGQTSHPTIQYSGKVCQAMRDAIVAILNASGLPAGVTDGDMRPLAVVLF